MVACNHRELIAGKMVVASNHPTNWVVRELWLRYAGRVTTSVFDPFSLPVSVMT